MEPVALLLFCPACGLQHVDAPSPGWDNPPHKSHLCRFEDGGCGHVWRPADVPTEGVAAIRTRGDCDSPVVRPERSGELRTLHRALALATRAFRDGELGSLATINEAVQPLADAAIAYSRRTLRPDE